MAEFMGGDIEEERLRAPRAHKSLAREGDDGAPGIGAGLAREAAGGDALRAPIAEADAELRILIVGLDIADIGGLFPEVERLAQGAAVARRDGRIDVRVAVGLQEAWPVGGIEEAVGNRGRRAGRRIAPLGALERVTEAVVVAQQDAGGGGAFNRPQRRGRRLREFRPDGAFGGEVGRSALGGLLMREAALECR